MSQGTGEIDYKKKMGYVERLTVYEKAANRALMTEIGFLLVEGSHFPEVSDDDLVQARYIAHRLDGDTHMMADMLAHQKPPGSRTDREFLRGHCAGNQFEKTPWIGDIYKRRAEAAGVDITGKVYYGTLAEYPGDPRAWITGRGDAQRLCEERGWGCEGAVNVKMREPANPPAEVAVAEDIVRDHVDRRLECMEPGDRQRADVGEIAHEVTEQLKPHWSK